MRLAICGCSWASDFDSSTYTDKIVTQNSQLWQYNLGYTPAIYARPGSSNLKIYTQVQNAIEDNFDMCLVFLTYPTRINIAWEDGWNIKCKFKYGRTEVLNKYSSKTVKGYASKYFNEDFEILNSFVITEAIYWKLSHTEKRFFIFTNSLTDYIHPDWAIFNQPNIIKDGPFRCESLGGDIPNHLTLKGQAEAAQLILSSIRKFS